MQSSIITLKMIPRPVIFDFNTQLTMSILPNYWDRQHFDSSPCRGKLLTSTRNATHYVDHFILKKYWDSIYLTHRHVGWRAGSLGTVRAGAPQISPATEDLSISFREFEWEYFWVFLYFCISVFLWELGRGAPLISPRNGGFEYFF